MNKARRKEIERAIVMIADAKTILEQVREEEDDFFNNMPESLQAGDRGQRAEERVDQLDDAISELDGIVDTIEEAKA